MLAVVLLAGAAGAYYYLSRGDEAPSAAVQRADEVTETMNAAQPTAQAPEPVRVKSRGAFAPDDK